MTDAATANIVTGIVTVGSMVVGFATLWVKLKYGTDEVRKSAEKVQVMEGKLDDNTRTTNETSHKADTIVRQTNGVTEVLQKSVDQLLERVTKLEEYNRSSSHRLGDAVNAVHLKVAAMAAVQMRVAEGLPIPSPPPPAPPVPPAPPLLVPTPPLPMPPPPDSER